MRDTQAVRAGDGLTASIGRLIEKSDCMLAILPRRGDSTFVSTEIAIALAKSTQDDTFTLIPIVIHETDVPYLIRDRVYVNFKDRADFSYNVHMIADAILSSDSRNVDVDEDAIRKAAIDAQRTFLELTKAYHANNKSSEYKLIPLTVLVSVISVVATAAPWIFAKGLSYNQLGSSVLSLLMLGLGFAFGRFSTRPKSRDNVAPSSKRVGP